MPNFEIDSDFISLFATVLALVMVLLPLLRKGMSAGSVRGVSLTALFLLIGVSGVMAQEQTQQMSTQQMLSESKVPSRPREAFMSRPLEGVEPLPPVSRTQTELGGNLEEYFADWPEVEQEKGILDKLFG